MRTVVRPLLLPLIVLVLGCVDAKKPPPPAAPVKGTVTLDGKPLSEGEIILSQVGEVPSVLEVKDGAFTGSALTGKNRVEIRSFKAGKPLSTDPEKTPTKKNILPERYNIASQLTADVAAGAANEFAFEVTAR